MYLESQVTFLVRVQWIEQVESITGTIYNFVDKKQISHEYLFSHSFLILTTTKTDKSWIIYWSRFVTCFFFFFFFLNRITKLLLFYYFLSHFFPTWKAKGMLPFVTHVHKSNIESYSTYLIWTVLQWEKWNCCQLLYRQEGNTCWECIWNASLQQFRGDIPVSCVCPFL